MCCIMELRILPLDKKSIICERVARITKIIDNSGLKYTFRRMSILVEGSWGDLQKVVGECFKDYEYDCPHFIMDMSISYRASRNKMGTQVSSAAARIA